MASFVSVVWIVGLLPGVRSVELPTQMVKVGQEQELSVHKPPIVGVVGDESVKSRTPPLQEPIKSAKTYNKVLPSTQASQKRPTSEDDSVSTKSTSVNIVPSPAANDRDIVVSGRPLRGSVMGTIPAERTYTAVDIRANGSDNIDTLIQSIGSQTVSNRGRDDNRPLFLLNGRRISSFAEIAKIPTEAIERMEVFPEELALSYGFQPNQKVVNIVTFETFTSRVARIEYSAPTDGGYNRVGAAGTVFSIKNGIQFNLNAEFYKTGTLLESERAIRQAVEMPDAGRFRSILPKNQNLSLSGVVSGPILNNVTASINGRFETDTNRTLLGFGSSGQLLRNVSTNAIHLGFGLKGHAGKWLWSTTGNYDHDNIGISSTPGQDFGLPDNAVSSNAFGEIELLTSGPVLNLPAGAATVSLRAGLGMRSFISKSQRDISTEPTKLSRDSSAFQASLNIPISSSRKGAAALGRLTANANVAVEKLSDFRLLKTFGYGIYWSPVNAINIYLSSSNEQHAPTVEQLGAPQIETPNLRSFDFVRGQSVIITQISGGNPVLLADTRSNNSLGIYVKPFIKTDFVINLDYVKTRVDNPIFALPIATTGIEAVFPERFLRDAGGQLLRIDGRPLNFNRSDQRRLRSGISFSRSLGKGPPPPEGTTITGTQFYPNEAAMRAATPPGVTIIEAAPGSDDAKRIDALASRFNFALYHTLNIEDRLLVQSGGPTLDLLNGSANSFRGGTPRHEIQFQAGVFKNGLGARASATWRSKTTIRSLPADNGDDTGILNFSNYTTANLSLFAIPTQFFDAVNAPRWLAGIRCTIDITNIFNSRPKVTNGVGATPLNYQAAYLEPLGRVVRVGFRTTF